MAFRRRSTEEHPFTAFEASLAEARKPDPVYLFAGAELYFLHRGPSLLATRFQYPADAVLRIHGDEAKPADVLSELYAQSFFAANRLIVLDRAEAFVSRGRKALESYLAEPARQTCLALVAEKWGPRAEEAPAEGEERGGKKFYDDVKKRVRFVPCDPLDPAQAPAWTISRAKERGWLLTPMAARALVDRAGVDLAALDTHLEKLSTYAGKRPIDVPDVEALVGRDREFEAFALVRALENGRAEEALRVLERQLREEHDPSAALGQLVWFYRRTLTARRMLRAGKPPNEVISRAKVWYNQNEFLTQARGIPLSRLKRVFRCLLDAELSVKRGLLDPETAMQALVAQLART